MTDRGKSLAIMQPYFLPYIGYFQLIASVDKFVIFDDVNFINKGWINRNRMLVNGAPHIFTIPLRSASQNRKISEIEIADITIWRKKLIRTIDSNYKNAPHFKEAMPVIEKILVYPTVQLSAFLLNSIRSIMEYLNMADNIIPTSRHYGNTHLTGQSRIIDICQQEKANIYINAVGGQNLYSREDFLRHGLALKFLQAATIEYEQDQTVFHESLSMLDVLMRCSKVDIQNNLREFRLI